MGNINILSPEAEDKEEEMSELSLRPKVLKEYIGQKKVKENMKVYIEAAKKRGESLDHVLLYGPPGRGKNCVDVLVLCQYVQIVAVWWSLYVY